jgi:uncharacterized protein (TIGR02246 family)
LQSSSHALFVDSKLVQDLNLDMKTFIFFSILISTLSHASLISEAKPTIEAANQAWIPAMKNHEAKPISSAYKESGVFVKPDGSVVTGRSSIEKMYEDRFKLMKEKVKDGNVVIDGTAESDGRVYEWGHAWINLVDEKGKATKKGGPYLTIWEKEKDGHWYISRNLAL